MVAATSSCRASELSVPRLAAVTVTVEDQARAGRWREWAPPLLRVMLGVGLMIHGGIKLFVPGGHENISHMVGQLGVPFADSMGWVVGAVECFGGLGILLGLLFPISVGLNVLNVGLLVLGGLAGGIRTPCRAATTRRSARPS